MEMLKIDPRVYLAKFPRSCDFGRCKSHCCRNGVCADRLERELILRNSDLFIPYLRQEAKDPASWFGEMEEDSDYPSGISVETGVAGGYCVFFHSAHGCCLQKAACEHGLHEWKFKPRYCVMFPLLVNRGVITVDEEKNDVWCLMPENRTHPILSALEKEVNFLFPREVALDLLGKDLPHPE